MDRREIALRLTLKELRLPVKMETFDDRLVFQKAIYLAQAAGIDMGYFYGWHLRGPYCSDAAADGYSVANELAAGPDESEGWQLDAGSLSDLGGIKSLFETSRDKLPQRLELLASVHYLVVRKQVDNTSPGTISRKLRSCGKPFSEEQVKAAMGDLRDHGLF